MPDYSKGKIYCIRSHNTDLIYIGSTIQPLSVRIGGHKKSLKGFLKDKKNYCYSFKIFEWGDAYIELLELYPCKNREELLKKEGEYIRKMKCVNKSIAGRTKKEYYEFYKEKILKRHYKYYYDNKKKINERNNEKNREKIICICGSTINRSSNARHKRTKKHLDLVESQK